MTKIHILKKKSEAFSQLKMFATKLKAQGKPMQRFRNNNSSKFDYTEYKKQIQTKEI